MIFSLAGIITNNGGDNVMAGIVQLGIIVACTIMVACGCLMWCAQILKKLCEDYDKKHK